MKIKLLFGLILLGLAAFVFTDILSWVLGIVGFILMLNSIRIMDKSWKKILWVLIIFAIIASAVWWREEKEARQRENLRQSGDSFLRGESGLEGIPTQ